MADEHEASTPFSYCNSAMGTRKNSLTRAFMYIIIRNCDNHVRIQIAWWK